MSGHPLIPQRPKVNPTLHVERRQRAGQEVFFVLDPESPAWAVLNRHGLSVLERCDGSRTPQQISAEIAVDYRISREDARIGTETFLSHMNKTRLLQLGITIIQFPPLARSGRARRNWQALRLSDAQRLWLWKYLSRRAVVLKGRMDILADCLSIDIHNPGVPYRCSIGSQLRMDPRGDLYPCQCFHFGSEFRLGNIHELNLEQVVKGARLKGIVERCIARPDKISGCSQCRWRNFCGAGCMGNAYEAIGSALKPDKLNASYHFMVWSATTLIQ